MQIELKRTLFLLLFCLCSLISFGTDLPITILEKPGEVIGLNTSIVLAIAKDDTNFNPSKLRPSILQPEFRPISEWEGKIEVDQTYWGAFRLENSLTNGKNYEDWIIEFSTMNSNIEVYVITADEEVYYSRTGSFIPLKEHSFVPKPGSNVAKLTIPFGQQVKVYFKTKCARKKHAPEFSLKLSDLSTFMRKRRGEIIWDGIYIGFALLLLLYNLILNIKVKRRSYLFYSAYIFGIVVYASYRSGFLANALSYTPLANFPPSIQFFKLSIYFSLVCYLYFSRRFLRLSRNMPRWDDRFRWLTIAAIPCIVIESCLIIWYEYSYYPSDLFNIIYALVFVGFSFCFAFRLYQKKEILGWSYIAAGTFLMSFGIIVTAVLRLQELAFSLAPFQISSIGEFMCFSLGLADARMKNEQEKQRTALELEKNKLKLANQTKEALNQLELKEAQRRFYDNMTHEFKTPITVIKGIANFEDLDNSDREIIKKNADKLIALVQEQLKLSQSNSSKLPLNISQFDLINTLQNWIEDFSPNVKFKQQKLNFNSKSTTIHINSDINHLEKIVYNLIGNACKFTPNKGIINVRVKEETDAVQIAISDSGIGISKKDLAFIFHRAYQADSPQKEEGSGIGLSLVKEMTQLIKGEIKVESELGKGSTFTLILPKIPFLEIEEPHLQFALPQKEEHRNTIEENMTTDLPPSTISEKESILIIEDNEDIIYLYKKILRDKFRIEVALNGLEGYDKASELVPDIIICDVMMPEMNGFQVSEKLRANPATNHIPIIMVTAKTNPIDKRQGLRNGVDYYMTKPFDNEELVMIIENLQIRKKALLDRFKTIEFESSTKSDSGDIFKIEKKFIQDLVQIVEKDLLTNKLLAPDIATELGFSLRTVRKKLKNFTGFTIPQFITNYRVYKAKKLLKETDDMVQTIGYAVGFSAPEVFNREFKKIVNLTPNQFRNNS